MRLSYTCSLVHPCRFCLLAWLLMSRGAHWCLEQPVTSLMYRHRRFQELCRAVVVPWPYDKFARGSGLWVPAFVFVFNFSTCIKTVHACIYTQTYMYIHMHLDRLHMHVYTYTYTCIHIDMHIYIYIYICIHLHIHVQLHIHACVIILRPS